MTQQACKLSQATPSGQQTRANVYAARLASSRKLHALSTLLLYLLLAS